MNWESIRYEVADGVATLTMHRPERMNAIGGNMFHELRVALADAATDRSVRVLVLTGAGDHFCPGADIHGVAGADDGTPVGTGIDLADFDVTVLLHDMPAVTIAAIRGACAGAGLAWACACDLRIAARSARFNTAFLDVGVAGDMGGPWTLTRIVGAAKARELYFLPDKFGADEALAMGLVARVVDTDALADEVHAIASRLAAAAPRALAAMKRNFVAAERMDLASFVALETERHLALFATEDTKEAFRARAEKRAPHFHDR